MNCLIFSRQVKKIVNSFAKFSGEKWFEQMTSEEIYESRPVHDYSVKLSEKNQLFPNIFFFSHSSKIYRDTCDLKECFLCDI